MATKEGLGWFAGLATAGLVATSASKAKVEKEAARFRDEAARATSALSGARALVADLEGRLAAKQAECNAAYADRNRWRESFDATAREATGLRGALEREASLRTEAEAHRDRERGMRAAAQTRADAAAALVGELQQQNAELARELAELRSGLRAGD